MKQFLIYTTISMLVIACRQPGNAPVTLPSNEAVPVIISSIQTGKSMQVISASGLLQTENESKLAFKVGGIISNVYADEGDFVRKNQLLATLKGTEIRSQVDQVQLSADKALRDYERIQRLYADSVATLEQLQNARTGLEIAQQGVAAVRFNATYANIYAPSDGYIVKRLANTGEMAEAGSPVFIVNHVSQNSHWVLKLGLTDAEWAVVKTGDSARVTFDAFADKQFTGLVSRKSRAADAASGAFEIEIKIDFGQEHPASGMFGKAVVFTGSPTERITIPYAALLEADGNKGYVFVTADKQKVQKVQVTLGALQNDQIEILQGLPLHTWVVISGSPYLSDNSLITPTKSL